jgi:hypothetical protein
VTDTIGAVSVKYDLTKAKATLKDALPYFTLSRHRQIADSSRLGGLGRFGCRDSIT